MEDKELDKIFHDAFIKAEENPNPKIWENIETTLDDSNKRIYINSKKYRWIYSAAAVLILGIGGYFLSKRINNQELLNSMENQKIVKSENNIITKDSAINKIAKAPNNYDRLSTNVVSDKIIIKKEAVKQTYTEKEEKRTKVQLDEMPEVILSSASMEINTQLTHAPVVRQVTEIDDIKPFIEHEEESETMLATTDPAIQENKNIITTVLNKISANIDPKSKKEVRFYADEEGSLGINIINSVAKNRNKKRK